MSSSKLLKTPKQPQKQSCHKQASRNRIKNKRITAQKLVSLMKSLKPGRTLLQSSDRFSFDLTPGHTTHSSLSLLLFLCLWFCLNVCSGEFGTLVCICFVCERNKLLLLRTVEYTDSSTICLCAYRCLRIPVCGPRGGLWRTVFSPRATLGTEGLCAVIGCLSLPLRCDWSAHFLRLTEAAEALGLFHKQRNRKMELLLWTLLVVVTLWKSVPAQEDFTLKTLYPVLGLDQSLDCDCGGLVCEQVTWFRTLTPGGVGEFLGRLNQADRLSFGEGFKSKMAITKKGGSGFSLRIQNVSEGDRGVYSCVLKIRGTTEDLWRGGTLLLPGETPPTETPTQKPRAPPEPRRCHCSSDTHSSGCGSLVLWPLVGLISVLGLALVCTLLYFHSLPKKCRHRFIKPQSVPETLGLRRGQIKPEQKCLSQTFRAAAPRQHKSEGLGSRGEVWAPSCACQLKRGVSVAGSRGVRSEGERGEKGGEFKLRLSAEEGGSLRLDREAEEGGSLRLDREGRERSVRVSVAAGSEGREESEGLGGGRSVRSVGRERSEVEVGLSCGWWMRAFVTRGFFLFRSHTLDALKLTNTEDEQKDRGTERRRDRDELQGLKFRHEKLNHLKQPQQPQTKDMILRDTTPGEERTQRLKRSDANCVVSCKERETSQRKTVLKERDTTPGENRRTEEMQERRERAKQEKERERNRTVTKRERAKQEKERERNRTVTKRERESSSKL
ncbi:hypothetical protein WMY93_011803 [Mugilogobius chulae]|uniref:Ig-like domain-containing protein n=1 Tax=Mugilogobius chulae TaxID=88201 RepID=A0AAW0PCJ9_9GOBI